MSLIWCELSVVNTWLWLPCPRCNWFAAHYEQPKTFIPHLHNFIDHKQSITVYWGHCFCGVEALFKNKITFFVCVCVFFDIYLLVFAFVSWHVWWKGCSPSQWAHLCYFIISIPVFDLISQEAPHLEILFGQCSPLPPPFFFYLCRSSAH